MTNQEKIEVFKDYLNFNNKHYIGFAEYLLGKVPDYFFTIPASSSGKHHPNYCLGEGGLVRHTKAAVKIGKHLCDMHDLDTKSRDIVTFSLLFHDCIKKGLIEEEFTVFNHPILAQQFVLHNYDILLSQTDSDDLLTLDINIIGDCIASHMGRWNKKGEEILPLPHLFLGGIVHTADYIASRKGVEITC